MVLAPVVRGRKGEYGKLLEELRAEGFARVLLDGELRGLDEEIVLEKQVKHEIAVVVDRLVMRPDVRKRLVDSIETAAALADGIVAVTLVPRDGAGGELGETLTFSEKFACLKCGTSMPELEPRIFSFNAPQGMCQRCTGLGSQLEIDPELVVPDPALSIAQGALAPWAASSSAYYDQMTAGLAERYGVDLDAPWQRAQRCAAADLPLRHQRRARRGALPQPLRARARLRGALRGHRPEPPAPLPRDRVRAPAREDRGVHERAAVPRLPRRAAAAGVARGARRGDADQRVLRALGARRAGVAGRRRAERHRTPHRAADRARDRRAPALPRERRHRLSLDGPRGRDAVGRRGAADPPGDADRLGARRRALRARRALDRAAPARQREARRDARAPARPGQHGARGRARRADDARRRPPRGPRARRRRARRADRRAGNGERGRAGRRVADRAVPLRHGEDRGAGPAAHAERGDRDPRRHAAQPAGDRRAGAAGHA